MCPKLTSFKQLGTFMKINHSFYGIISKSTDAFLRNIPGSPVFNIKLSECYN